MIEGRVARKREAAFAVATAFHAPEKINDLYPAPLPEPGVKWWGVADA
jgi:hypothetical protein